MSRLRILFVLASKPNKSSMNVCIRNLQALQQGLQGRGHLVEWWSIASDPDPGSLARRRAWRGHQWDLIICVYATRFVEMDYVDQLLAENPDAKLGWWSTEYDITRPYGFKQLEFVLLNYATSYYDGHKRFYRKALVADYNALVAQPLRPAIPKTRDCLYYGRYRPGRAVYFRRYLNDPGIDLSTSKRNVKNYYREGIRRPMLDKLTWAPGRETLRLYRASLYIEDELSHRVYNHPASRWYEALACRTYSVIDRSCMKTLFVADVQIPDPLWIDGPGDIRSALEWMGSDDTWLDRWTEQALAVREHTIARTAAFLEGL